MGRLVISAICAMIAFSTGSIAGGVGTGLAALVLIALASFVMRLLFGGMFK